MEHLLYSSNEMYSSTELIRKSKTIFNKIISEEIDKAIILRDGKPSFILLDFVKYEKILAEYDELKANLTITKDTKKTTSKKDKKAKKSKKNKIENKIIETKDIVEDKIVQDDPVEEVIIKEEPIVESQEEIQTIAPVQVVPPKPTYEEEIIEQVVTEVVPTQEELEVEKQMLEETVQGGLEVLDDLDFDDEFKKEVERKVRIKQERDFAIQKEEDKKEEKLINDAEFEIQKEKETTQLKEFWA